MKTPSVGTWLSLPNESIAEIFAKAGYDWIVIDLEHSSININQAEALIRTIDLAGSKPFVRLSDHNPSQIKRVLDAGAKGILAPMIDNAHQIQAIINACHYPPTGHRGMGLARAQGYGAQEQKHSYIKNGCNEIEIFAQIESMEAVKNVTSIFSKAIDGYFIGPYDLSASMGSPGNFETEAFKNAEGLIIKAARDANIKAGYHLVEPSIEGLSKLSAFGYNMIAYSVDIRMLDHAARKPFHSSDE
jgi:2-keto-3-deoxy-L-rhamnonate aldolase RhmA